MSRILRYCLAFGALAVAGSLASQQKLAASSSEPVKIIQITAKKYDYSPDEIHLKKGERVKLKVRAVDRTHGLRFSLYPDGAYRSGPPGLRFEATQDNWKLEKDEERVIEFVAERPGTYGFKCSVFCGLGHSGMSGKIVVEE